MLDEQINNQSADYPEHPVVMAPVEQVQVFPETVPHPPEPVKKQPRQRHFLAVFFISFMWGTFGVDRMYMGFIGTGIVKLITFGGFGLWTIVDFSLIMAGAMKDKQDRPMLQYEEYKVFAKKTVFWFTIILIIFIVLNLIALVITVVGLFNSFHNGSFNQIPGLNQLQNGNSSQQSQINSLINQ